MILNEFKHSFKSSLWSSWSLPSSNIYLKLIRFLILIQLLSFNKCVVYSYVDLFLDANETSSLLGFPGSLFYVFNGELRPNSIMYKLDIPEHKNTIDLNWKTSGFHQIHVGYKFKLIDSNWTDRVHKLSVSPIGYVPANLSKFSIIFNCSSANSTQSKPDSVDLSFNVFFELNNSLSTGFQQLISMPPLNFTINFHKNCIKMSKSDRMEQLKKKSRTSSMFATTNYAIAYIIIATLGGFALVIASTATVMFIHNKFKLKKLHSKYESLHTRLNQIQHQQQLQKLEQQNHVERSLHRSSAKTKKTSNNNNKHKQNDNLLKNKDTSNICCDTSPQLPLPNEQNIYESLQDSSVIAVNFNSNNTNNNNLENINENGTIDRNKQDSSNPSAAANTTTTTTKLISSSKRSKYVSHNHESSTKQQQQNKLILNLTTNTIQSIYTSNNANNTSQLISANQSTNQIQINAVHKSSSSNSTSNNNNNIELCTRFARSQIEIGNLIMEGTFSRILEGTLTISHTNNNNSINLASSDDKSCDETAKESHYDNFETKKKRSKTTKTKLDRHANPDGGNIRVMIKMVNDYASLEQTDLMLKESCVFRGLKHKNLSSIIGICLEPDKHPLAIFNYSEMGNLKNYLGSLKKRKMNNLDYLIGPVIAVNHHMSPSSIDHTQISTQELLYLILQMLKALNYLHGKRVIHKDIATRNCWLDANFSLKLADYALPRDMFPQDYHCLANNENKPIAWMALESINESIYSAHTDIWSCGVFIWECFSLASQPYEHVDPFEIADYLIENEMNRLENPTNCPNELYEIYFKCWHSVPSLRPTLKELFYALHKLYNTLDNYV